MSFSLRVAIVSLAQLLTTTTQAIRLKKYGDNKAKAGERM